jgi:hypothetical protein
MSPIARPVMPPRAVARPTLLSLTDAIRSAEERELRAVRRAIRDHVGREAEALRTYRRRAERALARHAAPATAQAVFTAALAADVVLIGDYHTLAAAQRAALALVRALARRRPLVLGLEMVRTEHQAALDAYATGAVSESVLRNMIRYRALWPFPWSSYGPLLALAREAGVRLLALDGRGSLDERDRIAAERIATSRGARPDALHVALVGDLHVAPPHLPAALAARRPGDRLVVVHQNLADVYEELREMAPAERTPAADLGGGHFCLITSTPLARERSYLAWLDGGEEEPVEPALEIERIGGRLAATLALPAAIDRGLADIEVFVRGGKSFLRALEAAGCSFADLIGVQRQVAERAVAVAGPAGPVYLGQPDEEHFAAVAAGILQVRMGEPPLRPDRADAPFREADLLAAVRRETFAVVAWRLVEPLAGRGVGQADEPWAVAFDPAAGPPPVHSALRVERRARQLRAAAGAHLARGKRFTVASELLAESASFRAAVARAVGMHYADAILDGMARGRVAPASIAALMAPDGRSGRPRERRAFLGLAALARAARRAG